MIIDLLGIAEMKKRLSLLLFLSCLNLSQVIFLKTAAAQVTPDRTTSTTVDVNGNDFTINQGDRAGGNLFHSFGEFSVPTDGSAFFNNAADIVNIFSRVTEGNISNIDGLLRANGSANLFLLNPAGILFGPNARLDIGGSFFGTTADSFLFEDGEFSATDLDNPPLLTINAPIGLNLRDNPEDIVNQSVVQNSTGDVVGLEVLPGENLTLVGGNINFEAGNTTAGGGNIELGGLSSAGTVTFNDDGSLSFPEDVAKTDITLNNAAKVDVRGTGGGNITMNARNLNLEAGDLGSSSIRAGIAANSDFDGAQAGDININATGAINLSGDSSIQNRVNRGATGNSGDINVTAQSLTLTEGSIFSASTFGQGNGGAVNITATDTITIDGEDLGGSNSGAFSTVISEAEGNAGDVTITTGTLTLTNGARVSANTLGQGNAGSVEITATDTITIDGEGSNGVPSRATSQVRPEALGNAGDVTITTGNLNLTNGGNVSASTFGQGDSGKVKITANNDIKLNDNAGIFSRVDSGAVGNSDGIEIKTGSLSVTNLATLNASSNGKGNSGRITITATNDIELNNADIFNQVSEGGEGDSEDIEISARNLTLSKKANIFTRVLPADKENPTRRGNAGSVTITTESLSLSDEGTSISARASRKGNSGRVTITATNDIELNDGADIFSTMWSTAEGNSEGIDISARNLTLTQGGRISATTRGQGNAGAVTINARESITITGVTENDRSGLFANAFISKGNGGNVNVFTNQLTIDDGGTIEASNFDSFGVFNPGTGQPGNINIEAHSLSLTNEARINAATQSETGNRANINLQLTEDLILRDNSFISARALEDADGGNLNINARFILDFPSKGNGNDIIATAERGTGGNITINARQLFNLQEGRAIDSNGNFIPNNRNDIDASSQAEGLDGKISISNPDANIRQIDTEIPNNIVEPETLGINACSGGGETEASSFTVKGKGGIPPLPTERFTADALIPDGKPITMNDETDLTSLLVEENETEQLDPYYIPPHIKPIKTTMGDIYPARGIIKTEDGKIILTRYPTDNVNIRTPHKSSNCTG